MRSMFPRAPIVVLVVVVCGGTIAPRVEGQAGGATQAPPHDPIGPPTQFDNPASEPYDFDQIRGEWVNLETQQVKPIAVSADGQVVAVANDADGRVVFYDADLAFLAETRVGQGICSIVERPGLSVEDGEFWVSQTHQSSVAVIRRSDFRVSHIVRPAIGDHGTGAGHASSPMGLDFNRVEFTPSGGSPVPIGGRAYVAAGHTNALWVVDATAKSVTQVIPLVGPHNGRTVHLNEPRAVVQHGAFVYVASHLSGNQTTTSQSVVPGQSLDVLGPDTGLPGDGFLAVEDLSADPDRSLPDFDVARVDLATGTILMVPDLFTIGFGMLAHPVANRLLVTGFRSRNGEFAGEGAFPDGAVVRNGLAMFRLGAPLTTQGFLVTEDLGPSTEDLVLPIDLAVDSLGRTYVAAYGGSRVGVIQANGTYDGSIDTDDGPAGVAISSLARLYVYNRIENTVQSFDISGTGAPPAAPLASARLADPTYVDVKEGRRIFNTPNSGNGATNCASCHPEARKDGLGWNLQKFFDLPPAAPTEFQDLKGVMVTQDLRNLAGTAPYHWRGEQPDVDSFNGAFEGLLHGQQISQQEMDRMKSYLFSCNYPPNPGQRMNRGLDALGNIGFGEYTTPYACTTCHQLPLGTNASMTFQLIGLPFTTNRTVETAHFVGLWTKLTDTVNTDDLDPNTTDEADLAASSGFGVLHDGSFDSLDQFIRHFVPAKNIPALIAFFDQFDSGLAPFTSYCTMLDASTTTEEVARIDEYMIPQAAAGNGDLVASGRIRIAGNWTPVSLLYDVGSQSFVADTSTLGPFDSATLILFAQAGDAELLLSGVPFWSGERIALDRDRDGVRDGDEIAQGLDPRDPDTDGDGYWDGYDPEPLNGGLHILPAGPAQVVPGSVEVIFATTNSIKIQYETDTFSPTIVEFGETSSLGFTSGDGLLPTGAANTSNLWKRKHTAFLRPQPTQDLFGLRDGATYVFEIRTQAQNGVTQLTAVGLQAATESDGVVNARVDSIALGAVPHPTNGTITYTATVTMIQNTGNPLPDGRCIPGRFAVYRSDGSFRIVKMARPTANGQSHAVFTITTQPGEQVTGDLTRFDVPMFLTSTDDYGCDPPDPGIVPMFGRWSEGPSELEITAP